MQLTHDRVQEPHNAASAALGNTNARVAHREVADPSSRAASRSTHNTARQRSQILEPRSGRDETPKASSMSTAKDSMRGLRERRFDKRVEAFPGRVCEFIGTENHSQYYLTRMRDLTRIPRKPTSQLWHSLQVVMFIPASSPRCGVGLQPFLRPREGTKHFCERGLP